MNASTPASIRTLLGYLAIFATGLAAALPAEAQTVTYSGDDVLPPSAIVGNSGTGTLAISGGGSVNATSLTVGSQAGANGVATVSGAGSALSLSSFLLVGYAGTGSLTVNGGATLSLASGLGSSIGGQPGGNGLIAIDGPGSVWTNASGLNVGGNSQLAATTSDAGIGSLFITDGGSVNISLGSNIGFNLDSRGTVVVSGPGSSWTVVSTVNVGNAGTGLLSIGNGGAVNDRNGSIGASVGGTGAVVVDGAGSVWNSSSSFTIGAAGSGTLTVSNGGAIVVKDGTGTATLGTNAGATGILNIGAAAADPAAAGGILNAAVLFTRFGTGTVQFNTTASAGAPYTLTADGTAGGPPVAITGATQVLNTAGFTVVTGANTYTGGTTIAGGTFLANNATGSAVGTGPVFVANDAALGGSGFVGGTTTIAGGGHLAPTVLTFTDGLTLASGAILDFRLGISSTSSAVTGGVLAASAPGANVTVNVVGVPGFGPGTYPLIDLAPGVTSSGFTAADFTIGSAPVGYAYHFALSASGLALTVTIPPPVIAIQPLPQTASVDASASFSVGGSGGALSYQWYLNGVALTDGLQADGSVVAGAASALLAISHLQPGQNNASITVVLTTPGGSVTSDAASLVVIPLGQTITFGPLANRIFGEAPFLLGATASSGLPVSLSIVSGPATLAGNTLTLTGAGLVVVRASQAGDARHGAAASVDQGFSVAKASAVLALDALVQPYDGTPKSVTFTTVPAGLPVNVTYDGSATPPTAAGSYAVAATIDSPDYAGAANATFMINVTAPTIVTAPQSLVVPLGGLANFFVSATGTAPFTYQWYRNGMAIAGATTANLTVANVQVANVGGYAVVVTNAGGSVTSATAALAIQALALVNHAPAFNGNVDGSVQQMLAEGVTLNGSATITGDLLVPGTPAVQLNGHPSYGGTVDGTGGATPTNYQVTLNGSAALRHLMRRTSALALPLVSAPLAPTGTVSVTLNNSGQGVSNWSTLRNLTLNGSGSQVAVPAGAYGDFTANGSSGFTLGVAGATQPSVYYFQHLTLNGQAQFHVVGPVIVIVANAVSANSPMGNAAHPEWLTLDLFSGGLTLNGSVNVYGYVAAPAGTVTLNGGSQLVGGLAADRLTLNGSSWLRVLSPAGY